MTDSIGVRTHGSNPCASGCRCGRHRSTRRNAWDTDKRCNECGERKPLAEFHTSHYGALGHPIYHSRCKVCVRKEARERMRASNFAKVYGITVEEYDAMLVTQGGVCAICEKPERAARIVRATRQLSVDHDHATGRVRGLLCSACNRAIGLFGDDANVLESALRYLQRKGFVGSISGRLF